MAGGAGKRKVGAKNVSNEDGSKKRRVVTQEYAVQQKIRDNFKTFTSEETDVIKGSDGRTLRERLLHDLARASAVGTSSVAFGKLYYDSLRRIYAKPCVPHTALAPSDTTLEVDPALVKAILAAQRSKPDRLAKGHEGVRAGGGAWEQSS